MINYRPGELDQRIDIKYKSKVADGGGGNVITWQILGCNIFAKAEPLSGNEALKYNKLNAIALYKFVVRYREDIDETQKIIWNGDEYDIKYILGRGVRKLYLEFIAERGATL